LRHGNERDGRELPLCKRCAVSLDRYRRRVRWVPWERRWDWEALTAPADRAVATAVPTARRADGVWERLVALTAKWTAENDQDDAERREGCGGAPDADEWEVWWPLS
jgi:hypothetical protein